MKKQFIHLSTGDLYGNNHDINRNVETSTDIDVGTTYRLSKYVAEKFCNPNDLILRIRLPFDGRPHPKNLLVKIPKFTKVCCFVNDFTYVPDLVEATRILVEAKQCGIFNVIGHESVSVLSLLKNVLQLPQFQYDDDAPYNPLIISENNNLHMNNVSSDDKLRIFFKQTTLADAIKTSWNQLHSL